MLLNEDLKLNSLNTVINNLFNNTDCLIFRTLSFFWVPLSEVHFVLAALVNATDARHLINAFIYLFIYLLLYRY